MSLSKYYNNKALNYAVPKERLKNILELVGTIRDKKILDIGCGDGSLGVIFKKRGNEVVGVDISRKAVGQARKVLNEAIVADLNDQRLPLKSKTFDLIICSEVIEHLYTDENLLNESKRLLKNEGLLIITTPNILYWGHRLKFLLGRFNYEKEGPFDRGHVHFYTYRTIKNALIEGGFKIISENHRFIGSGLKSVKAFLPGVFAYQFIFLASKK